MISISFIIFEILSKEEKNERMWPDSNIFETRIYQKKIPTQDECNKTQRIFNKSFGTMKPEMNSNQCSGMPMAIKMINSV